MSSERWRQVDGLLQAALDLAPEKRRAFLDKACASDPTLRGEVESLIASYEKAGSFIEQPAIEVDAKVIAGSKKASSVSGSLNQYKIVKHIGTGGMGEVYLAQDTKMGRKVALKLLPGYFTSEEQRVRRFQQEARAAIALNHPNIVTIYEIGEAEGRQFIATEFIEGETLRQRMKSAQMKLSDVLDIATQSASALAAAHDAGIIHRDIKPENIMVRRDGIVKVLDFGLAKLAEGVGAHEAADLEAATREMVNTDTGMVMGTASYMSPEQARGQKVDARTDIWALGVVLYEMVAGRRPFEGETNTDTVASILHHEPQPLARFAPDAPDEMQWIIKKALRKKRDERYQTVVEMLTDLRALKQRLEFEAYSGRSASTGENETERIATISKQAAASTVGEHRASTGDMGTRTASSAEYIVSEIKRHKRGVVVALLAIIVVGAALLYALKFMPKNAAISAKPFDRIKVSKVTNNGKAGDAVVSPDGKYVVYVTGAEGQQSIWIRHIATGSDKEIVPAVSNTNYTGLAFSRDGSFIYYIQVTSDVGTLYRVPVLGGHATKLIENIDSSISLSPDGKRLAFIRGTLNPAEDLLMIANSDGTGEQKLARHKASSLYPSSRELRSAWGPAWSPDGETIVIAVRALEEAGASRDLYAVSARDGSEKQFTNVSWYSIGQIAWLADGSGLIVAASDQTASGLHQIWHVSYPGGQTRKVTNDANNYIGISLTADSSSLATIQSEQLSNIWLEQSNDAGSAKQITTNNHDGLAGLSWTPDGRIVYTTRSNGNPDVWIMNGNGSDQKALTSDAAIDDRPWVTADGSYILFHSNRTGMSHVWRMGLDGGNPLQLTNGSHEIRPSTTPDSQWVYFAADTSGQYNIWKAPVGGGEAVRVTDYIATIPVVSPDGKRIACLFFDEHSQPQAFKIGIIPVEGGAPLISFSIHPALPEYRWSADSRSIIYIDSSGGGANLWSQPVDGSSPKQLTNFSTDQIYAFNLARDGRTIALVRGNVIRDVVLINSER